MPSYIIDRDYRLLYFDSVTKLRFPKVTAGEVCYRVFNKTENPCRGCRCFQYDSEKKTRYYNRNVEREVLTSFTPLSGAKENDAWLVTLEEYVPDTDVEDENPEGFSDSESVDEVDLLTGLYRYRTFARRAISMLRKKPMDQWAMMAVDIRHFKLFNLQFGDDAGDQILSQIGTYLNSIQQQKTGNCEVGYWGEDDFYLVLPDDDGLIRQIETGIIRLIEKYDRQNSFPPCIGVYHLTEHASFRSLCDRAQLAASAAKQRVRDRIVYFEESMIKDLEHRHELGNAIRKGLKNREFVVFMQPKCNLNTGKIVGMEALARWKKADGAIVLPGDFIPYMEETGLITDLDVYMWEEVCRELRSVMDDEKEMLLPVSVNVSIADVYALDVPEVFRTLVERYGVPPKYLEVEITESIYARDTERINDMVHQLRKDGVTVLMDDFGSGYSSLNMLKDISVDILKIDMNFLAMNGENEHRGIDILRSVIQLADKMQIAVIAEGVETREQIELLRKMGCVYGQGYYYYRPMPMKELQKLIAQKENIDICGIPNRKNHIGWREGI
ncbi:putative bifunctional diguanylate cyclase/phosphodiesterase [Frisingicoccus sp.]|uniref:putative bifunctional diguanylate cyclase/phosphodiesterase n=1 Tax=Frisingicoccus sp. TaxID=1918627 RepID=UPI003AB3A2CC